MLDIPIFYGDYQRKEELKLTCGQFISLIEQHGTNQRLNETQLIELCISKLSGKALDIVIQENVKSWRDLKDVIFQNFSVRLSIKEKVEVRKKLKQQRTELIQEFYERCVQAQYLVSDDIRDTGFDREVILHFIIGLNPAIRDLVASANCSTLDEFLLEAKKLHLKDETNEDLKPDEPFLNYFDSELDDNIENLQFEILDEHETENCDSLQQWNCEKCSKSFKKRVQLNSHIHKQHNLNSKTKSGLTKKGFKCTYCPEIYKTKVHRNEHEDEMHKHLKKSCELCSEEYPEIKSLARHIAIKHCNVSMEGKRECVYCQEFKRRQIRDMKYHILASHFNQPDHVCKICAQYFERPDQLSQHIKTKHLNEKPFQCDKCEHSYTTKMGLRNHIIVYHEEQKELKCDKCNKIFRNNVYLKAHVTQTHRSEHNRFVCDDCGKYFEKKLSFKMHCLKEHTDAHEQEKYKIKCQNPGCSFTSLTKAHVVKHFERVHLQLKKFICTHCPKKAYSKRALNEHINGVHLNIKPHACDFCEFTTAYRSILNEHKRVAHGTQKYDCLYCEHSARYKGNLDKHIQNVHQKLEIS